MKRKKSFRRSYKRKPVIPLHKKKGFWIAVSLPVFFSALAYLLFFHPIFWIDDIRLNGNETVDHDTIVGIIDNATVSNITFFKSKTIFLARTSEMADRVLNEFPEIESARIKRSFPDSLTITIHEREAVAIWCRDDGDDCYLIDANGVIFKEAPITARLAVIRGGNTAVSLSEAPISRDNMISLMEIWGGVKDVVKIVEFGIKESDVIARTDEGWDAYFTLREPPSVQTERLTLAIKEQMFDQDGATLDYVDVRFENRVYFKYEDR